MYFFVRFQAFMSIVFGILLMLLGIGVAIYGFIQNVALVDIVNSYWLAGTNSRLLDARFYAAALGLGLFLLGMCTAACGQLLLVFADMAENTREANHILRGIRSVERNAVVYSPGIQVSNTPHAAETLPIAQPVDLPPAS